MRTGSFPEVYDCVEAWNQVLSTDPYTANTHIQKKETDLEAKASIEIGVWRDSQVQSFLGGLCGSLQIFHMLLQELQKEN